HQNIHLQRDIAGRAAPPHLHDLGQISGGGQSACHGADNSHQHEASLGMSGRIGKAAAGGPQSKTMSPPSVQSLPFWLNWSTAISTSVETFFSLAWLAAMRC